jgi:hypothetical protein
MRQRAQTFGCEECIFVSQIAIYEGSDVAVSEVVSQRHNLHSWLCEIESCEKLIFPRKREQLHGQTSLMGLPQQRVA